MINLLKFKYFFCKVQIFIYSEVHEALRKIRSFRQTHPLCTWLLRQWWHYLPYRFHCRINRALFTGNRFNPVGRSREQLSIKNKKLILKKHNTGQNTHTLLWKKKKCVDRAAYFYNRVLFDELRSASKKLQSAIDDIHKNNETVILAPLHMISDTLSGILCSFLNINDLIIISSHEDGSTGPEEREKLRRRKMNLVDPKLLTTSKLKDIVKQVMEKESMFVIYPDVPPEVTGRLSGKAMRTYDCRLFERQARLHSGLAELARLTKSQVLFFCMTDDGSKFSVDIIGMLPWNKVKKQSPELIERAITRHPDTWLLWHTPSLFYFNSADRS